MKKIKKSLSIFLAIITLFSSFSVALPVFAEGNLFLSENVIESSSNQDEMTSKIVREVDELREEKVKHFLCEDGSYIAATYSEPVHYNNNGQWEEINNNLELKTNVKSSAGKSMYATKSGVIDVEIPQNFSNGQKVSTTNKGHKISFGVRQEENTSLNKAAIVINEVEELSSYVAEGKTTFEKNVKALSTNSTLTENDITTYNIGLMSVENKVGAVSYENVFSNADLEYVVTANSIKENIVVKQKQNDYTYSFDMDFGELIPIINEDKSIRLVEPQKEDETVFYIAAPYMYDANKTESTDIEMSLVESGDGNYILTLRANEEWVNASDRAFPVVIDPTVYLSFNDVFVMDGVFKNDTQISSELRVGRNLANLTRTYIKPTLPANIPTGSYISKANIYLKISNYFKAINSNDISLYVYDCQDVNYWSPTNVTWNNQPYNNSNNGYKNGHTYITSMNLNSDVSDCTLNISSAAKKWFNGGVNNGIMIASSDKSTKTQVDFYSTRALISSTHPQMYIEYFAPRVSISSWSTDKSEKTSDPFTILTDSSWTAYSSEDWLSLTKTSGTGSSSSRIVVSENTSFENRTGTITVQIGNTVIGTITVTQHRLEPYVITDPYYLDFDAGTSKKTVNIESNVSWYVEDLPDWLTVSPSEGSGNCAVEIEISTNLENDIREYDIYFTSEYQSDYVYITQWNDDISPSAPNIYEEDGLVYMSTNSFEFNEEIDTPEHVEYKLGDSEEWIDYEDEPLDIIRTYDVPIYARTCDAVGNVSETTSMILESNLGEYTASYNDIALGEGVLPIGFERTYSSEDGWFFTFEANVAEYTNGYVFTDFYGNKQYFIVDSEGKYVSAYGDELKVEEGTLRETDYSYVVPYGEMECYFDADGKLAIVKDNYNTATYSWVSSNLYITDEAENTNIVRFSDGKPIYISVTRFDSETNSTLSKNVQYQWTNGNLTKFIDVGNNQHVYSYTNGLLTNNDGEVITYSAQNRVKKIAQPNGAFVKYTYNDTAASADTETPNNIGAVTVSDSKGVTDVWYYADGFAISNGIYSYSDNATYAPNSINGNITSDSIAQVAYVITVPLNEETEVTYEEYPLYDEDDEGNFTFYNYDSEGYVTEILFVKAGMLSVTEDTTFEQAELVAEEKTTYIYDENGNTTEEVNQKRVNGTLVNQEKTTYVYNDKESVTNQTDYQWISGAWYQTNNQSYTYNGYGNVTSQTTTVYTNTKNTETGLIETTSKTTTVSYEYNAWCQLVKVTTNVGLGDETISETIYDVFGRTTSVSNDVDTISYTYDNKGNVLTVTEDENVTSYTYSNNGNLVSGINPDGVVATYTYDNYGNLIGHDFNGYNFTYNTLGSILTAKTNDQLITSYTYSDDIKQNVLSSTFGNGQNVSRVYNDDGEITDIKLSDVSKYSISYLSETDENNEIAREWAEITDTVSELKKVIEGSKLTVSDPSDNFIYSIEIKTEDEEIEDSFDGSVTTIGTDSYTLIVEENKDTFKSGETVDFEKNYVYNEFELQKVTVAELETSYTYNDDNAISILTTVLNNLSLSYNYNYDGNGSITAETLTTSTTDEQGATQENIKSINYTYDNKEQLISAESDMAKYEYTYDNRGNILTANEYSVTVDESGEKVYNLLDADTYTYDTVWKDKLVAFNGESITYDAIGNPTSYLGNTLTWTMGRLLASFGDISYRYNERGIRTSKTSGGITTDFYLNGTNIIYQTDGTNSVYFYYDSNDELTGFIYNGNSYIYIKNLHGDITDIADTSGNIVASYTYDPWGAITSVTGSNITLGEINPFRYRGYYYDSDIQMYYLQSRYYDPQIKRFINCDDVSYIGATGSEISYNAFAYCANDCINGCDPYGNITFKKGVYFDSFTSYYYGGDDYTYNPNAKPTLKNKFMSNAWKIAASAVKKIYPDGYAFYMHYVKGNGKPYVYDYGKAIEDDASIRNSVNSIIESFIKYIKKQNIKDGNTHEFSSVLDKKVGATPKTFNWKLAIGTHLIAVAATVKYFKSERRYNAFVYVFAFDRYNFSSGTKFAGLVPGNWNGELVTCGLAQNYTSYGIHTTSISWR